MTEIKQPKIRFKGHINDWEQRKLGEVVEFYSGLTYSPKDTTKNDGTFVIRSSNIKNNQLVNADNVFVKSEKVNSKNVNKGDIVVVVRNGSRNLIGKHTVINKDMPNTVIGAFMTGIQSETPDFINALLNTRQFDIEINKNLGATINQITIGSFKNMLFNFTNKDEQEKIGEFFKTLDDTIALHQQKLEVTKQFKQTMLKKMFPKKDSNIPEIRFKGFTSEWKEQELKEFLSKPKLEKLNLTSPDDLMTLKLNLGGLVSSKNKTTLSLTSTKYYKRKAGQFIFGKQNFFNGSMAIIPERFNNKGTSSFVPSLNIKNINSYFLYLNMSRKDFYKEKEFLAEGTGSKVLSENTLLSFKIKITENSNEQELIGNYFKELDNKIKDLEQKLETYKEFKKAMLQKMFI